MPLAFTSQIQRTYTTLSKTITTVHEAHEIDSTLISKPNEQSKSLDLHNKEPTFQMISPPPRRLKQTLLQPIKPSITPNSISNPYVSQQTSIAQDEGKTSIPLQTTLKLRNSNDNIWIGHRLRKPRTSSARIWIQNVNGLNIKCNFNPYLEHLEFIKRYNISFLALTETHLNHQNAYVRENIEASHKMIYPQSHTILANTPSPNFEDTRQNGGILTSTMGTLAHRYAGGGYDPGGRFVWMDFYGREVFLRIYTIYRVCPANDDNAGDNQAWTLQREWLRDKGIQTNPRQQVLQDLKAMVLKDIAKKGKYWW